MRALLVALVVALGAVPPGDAATKPSDGRCECGQYIEAPALCRTLGADRQEPCRKSNAAWVDQCVAWQKETCSSGVLGAVAKPLKLDAPAALVAKYAGTWMGRTVCPRQGAWDIMLAIVRRPDGSYVAKAASQGVGEFNKFTLVHNNDTMALLYSSIFKDSSYTGHLVSPDRLEGSVKIQEDCSWFLTKSP